MLLSVSMSQMAAPEMGFPDRLRKVRRDRRLTQAKAAALCGVSEKTWGNWESGGEVAHYHLVVVGLADALQVPVEWLRSGPSSDMCPYSQLSLSLDDESDQPNGAQWKILPSSTDTEQRNELVASRPRRSTATDRSTRRSPRGLSDAA